jgi:hypothetical protein
MAFDSTLILLKNRGRGFKFDPMDERKLCRSQCFKGTFPEGAHFTTSKVNGSFQLLFTSSGN